MGSASGSGLAGADGTGAASTTVVEDMAADTVVVDTVVDIADPQDDSTR